MSNLAKLVNARIIKETVDAYLIAVELTEDVVDVWFPKSKIEIEMINDSAIGDIYVDRWFLDRKETELMDAINIEGEY